MGVSYDIRWKDVIRDESMREALHTFYRTAKEGNDTSVRERERNINVREFRDKDEWLEYEYWHNEDDQPMKRSFSKNKSVLCSSISSFLEEEGLNDIKLEHIFRESDNRRQVLDKLYRVPVPVSKCRITGLHDKDVEVLELTQ